VQDIGRLAYRVSYDTPHGAHQFRRLPVADVPAAATIASMNISGPLLVRGGFQDRHIFRALSTQRSAQKLPRLLGCAAFRQLEEDEFRRLVGTAVETVVEPVTHDLSDPGVVALPPQMP
jgi:hypothetical protein